MGSVSIGLIVFLFVLAGIMSLVLLLLISPVLALILTVPILIFIVLVFIAGSALGNIFTVALYLYASSRRVPKGFSSEFVKNVYKRK